MKIFSAAQIKQWDEYTITNNPISSSDLMEHAATACYNWIQQNNFTQTPLHVFCGKGNNGGDGLVTARLLLQNKCKVAIYIPQSDKPGSADFEINLEKLRHFNVDIHLLNNAADFPVIEKDEIIIDALFGTGLYRPVEGIYAALINHINESNAAIIAIDLPSGLYADKNSAGNAIIKATYTLSFQNYKLIFLLPEQGNYCGNIHLLDIGLHKDFESTEQVDFELLDIDIIHPIHRARTKFAHKGNFGHAALFCGSYGMMGAAVLSSLACLRTGAGKLTTCIPKCGYNVLQTAVPEAMCIITGEEYILSSTGSEKYDAVGIGPGIGLQPSHKELLSSIFKQVKKPMVIDADALNIIAQNPGLLNTVPPLSILTPHPKEFEKLFGKTDNDFERLKLALQKSKEFNIYIILKGHYSFISTPAGNGYFNSTGNAGMATAGSGDVLTGIITALLAQHYSSSDAALLGTYLHGLAGDIAAEKFTEEAMIAGDIVNCLGEAFKQILHKESIVYNSEESQYD
ncbi:MAG: NAD(P)H-hydrate dehydratase [Ferruginibacter sp.]